ncbi:MAG TPA: sulfatase [Vicinamibacterales bacterium]|nr:sulfatase [Vicinamibacterales bacterium]
MMRLLVLFVGLAMLATPARAADRNVVFFVADDHGTEALGAYGNRVVKTPSLDQLALDGVRFTHAFATTASCSASRSVLLTGVHNHRNGQYGHEHEYHHFSAFPNVRSLPVLLAEAGYRTARGGKFHVAPESVFRFQQVITLRTLEAFIKADSAKPFFVYYGTHEPHRPFNHDAEDRVDPRTVTVPPWLPDIPEVRDELALYEASVRKVDKAFGMLVDTLKRTGTYEDTLIVYLSDNGAPFPGSKTNVYEPGIRLPLIVKKPGQARQGSVNTAMISWVDITPTILDFAGVRIAPPPPSQPVEPGRFTNETPGPFASDLFASKSWQGALARKLATFGPRTIQAYTQRPAFELYDLERDPLESTNLAADPKHAHVLADLKARIKAFQERTGDPWVIKWRYE